MGGNQSKTPIVNEKLVIDRLRALEIKDQADSDYVHVGEKDVARPAKKSFKAPWTNLSVSDVEHWEHELLQDPKNRLVHLIVLCTCAMNLIAISTDSHSLH